MPYGFLLSAKTLCSELVNITEYFWKLLLHQDAGFHYTFSLLMLLFEYHEDSGNVVYMVADEAYFNYQREKNSRKIQRIQGYTTSHALLINLVNLTFFVELYMKAYLIHHYASGTAMTEVPKHFTVTNV
jgi:hypothetical protein